MVVAVTLSRSNRVAWQEVIDRTDDSGLLPVRVAVVGEPGLFLDVLIDALRGSDISAWWVAWDSPAPALLERLHLGSADLVLLDLGPSGYTATARSLIRHLAKRRLPTIVLDEAAHATTGRARVEAGALWGVNPSAVGLSELAATIELAATQHNDAQHRRRRADQARDAWAGVMHSNGHTRIISFDDVH